MVATFEWKLKNIHTTPKTFWMKVKFAFNSFYQSQNFKINLFSRLILSVFLILINYLFK